MNAADKIAKVGTGVKAGAVGVAVLLATGAAVYLGYKGYQAAKATAAAVSAGADAVGKALDPTADTNLAYRASNAAIGCGDGSCSLGTKIFDGVEAVKGWFK